MGTPGSRDTPDKPRKLRSPFAEQSRHVRLETELSEQAVCRNGTLKKFVKGLGGYYSNYSILTWEFPKIGDPNIVP